MENSLFEFEDLLNTDGFLSGANALSRDIIDNPIIKKYINDPKCAIILYENPPYAETTSIEFQKKKQGKESSDWKQNFIVTEMKKEIKGATTNDLANAFIWSGFKYFLRDELDSYIVFSPIKYWKSQHLIQKKFIDGYALNRRHFHAPTDACVSLISWSNQNDTTTTQISLKAVDIIDNKIENQGELVAKKCFNMISSKLYEENRASDIEGGILCDLNGLESDPKQNKKLSANPSYNNDKNDGIIGYLATDSFGLDNPRLHSCLTIGTKFNGHGFYMRRDNFLEKLPVFAASRYPDHCNDWKVMSFIMKTADKADEYLADIKSGILDKFLLRTMFWISLSHYPHLRSLKGSDDRLYINELCFDGDTLAMQTMQDFINKGYQLTDTEKSLLDEFHEILKFVKTTDEYNSEFKYGLYQIDEEINIKIQQGTHSNGEPKMAFKYGDLNNIIKAFKLKVKEYYKENLVDTLFEYEFLK
ncbi:hypothetical protein BKH46_07955 [Helicobacter sp. 12S02634-8]|nr:hypothetical protein BKH46_07955 [Helicobacter sp. 12S02634-8]